MDLNNIYHAPQIQDIGHKITHLIKYYQFKTSR